MRESFARKHKRGRVASNGGKSPLDSTHYFWNLLIEDFGYLWRWSRSGQIPLDWRDYLDGKS
jgi:hypothetical protein